MNQKAHILIVEDKSLLYKRLAMFLKDQNYNVSEYCPSVDMALNSIKKKTPDIALLDIDLKGEKTGLELGEILRSQFNIPFIYVTDYDDDETFYQGLATKHEHFLVKTKPHLDTKVLLRAIQTVLSKSNKPKQETKKSIMCYVGYISDIKQQGLDEVSQVPLLFDDITLISTKKRDGVKLKPNYVCLETFQKKTFYLPVSLSEIATQLPLQFTRINESEIVNLSEEILDGRINGSRLKIGDNVFHISKTYKSEVENRLNLIYQKVK